MQALLALLFVFFGAAVKDLTKMEEVPRVFSLNVVIVFLKNDDNKLENSAGGGTMRMAGLTRERNLATKGT